MTSPVPATIGRLFDGLQLVKRIHLYKESAPPVIQTNDMPPQRLRELDASFHEPDERRQIPFSLWEHTAWAGTDYLDPREWLEEFGPQAPPVESVLLREGKLPVVVVRYADYQKKGNGAG